MTNAPLNAENLDVYATKEGILLDTTVLGYLRSSGYNIEAVEELHTVVRDESDTGHTVMKLEVTTKPTDDPDFDAVADVADIWVCDCWNYLSEHWPDLREFGNSPTDHGYCDHIKRVSKEAKAASDENQEELL